MVSTKVHSRDGGGDWCCGPNGEGTVGRTNDGGGRVIEQALEISCERSLCFITAKITEL